MKLFRIFNFSRPVYSQNEQEEWDRLEAETVRKMKEDAQDTVDRLTPEEYVVYRKMKVLAAVFLPISFIACWWNLLIGGGICLVLSTVWFLIWFRKNMRYALIFYLTLAMSSSYFFITWIFDFIFHRG